jgi:hypothetical protein
MTGVRHFVRSVLLAVLELLVSVLRLIGLFVALVLVILAGVWMMVLAAFRNQWLYPEETDEADCGDIPEPLVRRPDPAIYSQRLLLAQGLPVTWNNPDIWIAPASNPGQIEPDSYHLDDDTDYIVTVQVHNASTDAAIGVRVRLRYRAWSFNTPDEVPVEVDANGNEVVHFVNITPLGATLTTFRWHTPAVPAGEEARHFCLQASLYHPLDTNLDNNLGQENTNVYREPNPGLPAPGDTFEVEVPIRNPARRTHAVRFATDTYAIAKADQAELRLKTAIGRAKRTPVQRAANLVPYFQLGHEVATSRRSRPTPDVEGHEKGRRPPRMVDAPFRWESRRSVAAVRNRYVGFDPLRDMILSRDYSLPPGMQVDIVGAGAGGTVELPPRTDGIVKFAVKVPDDAQPGDEWPLNLVAYTDDGALAGGVTVIVRVREP